MAGKEESKAIQSVLGTFPNTEILKLEQEEHLGHFIAREAVMAHGEAYSGHQFR